MHLQKSIEQFGYSANEAKVYLASLNMGEAMISEIAQRAKIPRTSVQAIIQDLRQKGLINFYVKRRRKYWIAENPEKLLLNLKEKEVTLKEVMPQLQALRYETGVQPAIKFYSGRKGIELILGDIIGTKHHILSLTSAEDAVKLLGGDFADFIEKRYARNLRVKFLTKKTSASMELKRRDTAELRSTRFLPDSFYLHNANFIYGGKVAIISLNKKLPQGIIIEDEDIAQTQAALFEFIWSQSSD